MARRWRTVAESDNALSARLGCPKAIARAGIEGIREGVSPTSSPEEVRGADEIAVSAPDERVDMEALALKRHALPWQLNGDVSRSGWLQPDARTPEQ